MRHPRKYQTRLLAIAAGIGIVVGLGSAPAYADDTAVTDQTTSATEVSPAESGSGPESQPADTGIDTHPTVPAGPAEGPAAGYQPPVDTESPADSTSPTDPAPGPVEEAGAQPAAPAQAFSADGSNATETPHSVDDHPPVDDAPKPSIATSPESLGPPTGTGDVETTAPSQPLVGITLSEPSAGSPAMSALSAPVQTSALNSPALTSETQTLQPASLAFLGLVGLPLTSGATAPTAVSPGPWALLWFVRRTFFNSTPTITDDDVVVDQVDGKTFRITVTPTDADGDPVTTTVVSGPSHGQVQRKLDGSYTYIADTGHIGSDSFVVRVSDAGGSPHSHGLSGFFALFGLPDGHSSTKTITIDGIAAGNQVPSLIPGALPLIDALGSDFDRNGQVTGSVAGMVAAPAGTTLTFSTDDPRVTVGADGTFVFVPTADERQAATAPGASQVANLTIVATGPGGSVQIPVTVPLSPNDVPTVILGEPSAPHPDTGAVSGTFALSDDDDVPEISVVGGTPVAGQPNTFVTPRGTVVIDPTAGTYTYTPNAPTRLAASYLDATDDALTDTITIAADDHRGGQTAQTMAVPIAPISQPGSPVHLGVGADGTVYAVSTVDGPGTEYTTLITRYSPAGDATSVSQPGLAHNLDHGVGDDGTVFVISRTGNSVDGYTLHTTRIGTDGTTTTVSQPDADGDTEFSAVTTDGSVYVTAVTGDQSAGYLTRLTRIATDGSTTTTTYQGRAGAQSTGVNAQGTSYISTTTGSYGSYTTHLTRIAADGTTVTHTQPGQSVSSGLGDDGTVYVVSTGGNRTHLTRITADGTMIEAEQPGSIAFPGDAGMASDGTVYMTSSSTDASNDYITHFTRISPDGTTVTGSQPGYRRSSGIGPDGTTYVVSGSGFYGDYTTHVTRIAPDGSIGTSTQPGLTSGTSGLNNGLSRSGVIYLTSATRDPSGAYTTYLTRIGADGTALTWVAPGDSGWAGAAIMADNGTIHSTRYTIDASGGYTVHYTHISADGAVLTGSQPGLPYASQITADGTAATISYTTTGGGDTYTTYVSVVTPDGTVHESSQSGVPADVRFAPDGTAYVASYSGSSATGYRTHVTRLSPDGSQFSTSIAGYPRSLQIGPDGSAHLIVLDGSRTSLVVLSPGTSTSGQTV